jgi:histidinol-phosphate aminotransferase
MAAVPRYRFDFIGPAPYQCAFEANPLDNPMNPTPKPGILDIAPYVGGRASVAGVERVFKLSANEGPLGPSPQALAAIGQALGGIAAYPEGSARLLREAIAQVQGLDVARIICGGDGSDEILHFLAHVYLRPGDEVIFTEHAFVVYRIAALANSAVPVAVPEMDTQAGIIADVDAMLAAVTNKTRMVFLANPNNPTGTYVPREDLRRLHAGLPPHVLLVVDAAYAEYASGTDYEDGMAMVSEFENVVVTRTFSKAYGLGGLRVGWAWCPAAIADAVNRIRGPFNLSMLQQAGAAAAMRDRAHLAAAVAHNAKWLPWLTDNIRSLGLRVDESAANFVLIHFPKEKNAVAADAFLSTRGLILRAVANYGLPDCLRLSVGTAEANERVVAALREFMGER